MPDATSFFSRCPRTLAEEKLLRLYYRDDPDIRHMTNKRWGPQLDEDGKPEGPSLRRIYPKCFEKNLLEAWPTLKSTLEEYGILCIIDLYSEQPRKQTQILFPRPGILLTFYKRVFIYLWQ
ncbi:hypothetical protein ACFX19_026549 [Malus domestica]